MIACEFCGTEYQPESDSPLQAIVCPNCKSPRALPDPQPTFFSVFGLKPAFGLDEANLARLYYSLSSALHPDRFSAGGNEAITERASDWMSLVNEAYQTLKKPADRRTYLLELLLKDAPKSNPPLPAELSEEWFTIQDLLMDDLDAAMRAIKQFSQKIASENENIAQELQSLEQAWDQNPETSVLTKMSDAMKRKAYVASLARNVERTQQTMTGANL